MTRHLATHDHAEGDAGDDDNDAAENDDDDDDEEEDEEEEEEGEVEEGEGTGEGGPAEFQCNKCDKSFKRRVGGQIDEDEREQNNR